MQDKLTSCQNCLTDLDRGHYTQWRTNTPLRTNTPF